MQWGDENYQEYPWRDVTNPWLALLAEVLLQRTNASHVERYYLEVASEFPTPEAVLNAKPDDLLVLEKRFGLDRRVRTIVELAYYLDRVDYYPDSVGELMKVFGIGHYTAAAFLSLHRNVRAVMLDSNIARLLSRLTGQDKPLDVRRSAGLWSLAEAMTPKTGFKKYNYTILDFTMIVCRPKVPRCSDCPVRRNCYYV